MENQLTIERFDIIEADYQKQLETNTDYTAILRLQGAIMAIRVLRDFIYPPMVLESIETVEG